MCAIFLCPGPIYSSRCRPPLRRAQCLCALFLRRFFSVCLSIPLVCLLFLWMCTRVRVCVLDSECHHRAVGRPFQAFHWPIGAAAAVINVYNYIFILALYIVNIETLAVAQPALRTGTGMCALDRSRSDAKSFHIIRRHYKYWTNNSRIARRPTDWTMFCSSATQTISGNRARNFDLSMALAFGSLHRRCQIIINYFIVLTRRSRSSQFTRIRYIATRRSWWTDIASEAAASNS